MQQFDFSTLAREPSRKRTLAFVFLFTLVFTGAFTPFDMANYPHEGVIFKSAIDLTEGKMLFRDSFTQYGPIPALLHAGAISLFGRYVLVPKILAAFAYGLIAIFLWLIWARFLPRWLATVSVIVWNLLTHHFFQPFLPWPSTYALLFQVFCIYAVFCFFEKGRHRHLFIAGSAAALAFLSKQNVGFFLIASQLVFFLAFPKNRLRNLAALLAGFFAVMTLLWVWLIANGAIHEWWLQSIVFGLGLGSAYGDGYNVMTILRSLFLVAPADSYGDYLFVLLPVACLVLFGSQMLAAFRRGWDPGGLQVASLLMACFASWGQYYPVAAGCYFWWASAPMVGLLVKAVYEAAIFLSSKARAASPRFVAGLTLVFLAALLVYPMQKRAHALLERLDKDYVRITAPESIFRGIYLSPERADFGTKVEQAIDRFVNTRYEAPWVVMDSSAALYLCMVRNARHFHPMWLRHPVYWKLHPEFQNEVNRFILEERPVIFADPRRFARFRVLYPEIFQIFTSHYAVAAKIGREFLILVPQE